ncbi:MAG: hypothetical protein J7647_17525 [Cyanobacteria bacterium SBLK]|nr:hypothetical protein [Cyanobacteria bacterium SBLK]
MLVRKFEIVDRRLADRKYDRFDEAIAPFSIPSQDVKIFGFTIGTKP